MDSHVAKINEDQFEGERTHSLGNRAFYYFLSRRLKPVLIIAVIVAALWYAERWVPPNYAPYTTYGIFVATAVSGAYLLFVFFQSFLEYRYYTYTFTDEAFLVTYGVIVRKEIAAPYHQIQHVVVQRTMSGRTMGVSQIIIFLAGADKEESQMKIVLPAIGKTKAKLVQKELLVRMREAMM